MEQFHFTNARLQKLVNATGKYELYKDTGQKGLFLRVTQTGTKIFRLHAWNKLKRKMLWVVIGHYPAVKINDARAIASEHLQDLLHGIDVAERIKMNRAEQTLDELFCVWLRDYAKVNNKRWDQDKRRYELYIEPHLGRMKLSEITPEVIRRWQATIAKQKKQRTNHYKQGDEYLSKALIHRALIVLSSVFSKTAPQMHNPCSEIKKYKPEIRTTFLKSEELSSFFIALDHRETPEYLRDYLLLSLYTGARKSNILSMRWEHIDLNLKIWMISGIETKNTEPMIVPLLDQAIEVLQRRKRNATSAYVFPTPRQSKTGHLVEPKKAWKSLLIRAKLPETYRLHDLRRTMGSWQAITGTSTKIIGASLGHKSEQATAHYAHLTIEPIRAAMQKAADAMDSQKK